MSNLSDTAQTLAAVAPFASGPTRVTGIGFIRRKETNRVAAVVTELRRLGIRADEEPDGFIVHPGTPKPARIETYDDHRMAMSFAVIGLLSPGIEILIRCVQDLPDFFETLEHLRVGEANVLDDGRAWPTSGTLSIDLVGGAVMLMALDHARDLFGFNPEPTDLATTNAVLFVTRCGSRLLRPGVRLGGNVRVPLRRRHGRDQVTSYLLPAAWPIILERDRATGGIPERGYHFPVLRSSGPLAGR
jgi:hypothetical protein